MFEDIEKFLSENRTNKPTNKNSDLDVDKIAEVLAKKFGDGVGVTVERVSESDLLGRLAGGGLNKSVVKRKIQGIADSLHYIGTELGLKPVCLDSNGLKLKKGDRLKVPSGKFKTVLGVGFGFVSLSHTDDLENDGIWFENEIKELKFIKE